MQRYGTIESDAGTTPIRHDDWLSHIASATDLVRPEPRPGRNPANGEPIMLQPPADTVHLLDSDVRLATFSWGPPDHNCINVQYNVSDAEVVVARAKFIADALSGTFRDSG